MGKSPGHRQRPEHVVREIPVNSRVQATVAGEVVADSTNVIKVEEDGARDRYYFPRADVRMDALERTDTTTRCPFKGTANYYTMHFAGKDLPDAVWSYEDPYEEHQNLKDRLAFYEEKAPGLEVRPR